APPPPAENTSRNCVKLISACELETVNIGEIKFRSPGPARETNTEVLSNILELVVRHEAPLPKFDVVHPVGSVGSVALSKPSDNETAKAPNVRLKLTSPISV